MNKLPAVVDRSVKRPLVCWHGGKWRLAPWIISHFPDHRCYVEPFGGGGSVLLRKARSYFEVYNDLDCEIVNLFQVVRDNGAELRRRVELTPFARDEFDGAYNPDPDPMERARALLIRSFMGFGSYGRAKLTGFRSFRDRRGTPHAHDWANYPKALGTIIERLQGVVIENRDALDVMRRHDSPDTLHYVDPPYVHSTRDDGTDYTHEMDDEDHKRLAECLSTLQGFVILSGYGCELYDSLYAGWQRVDRTALADGARLRVESLWLNDSAASALSQKCLWEAMSA